MVGSKIKIIFLLMVSWLVCPYLFANETDSIQKITLLSFQNQNAGTELEFAKDDIGHTWVRGQIPAGLLQQRILFQNHSIHIADYDLYASIDGKLQVLKKNIDAYGQPIKSRFPVYSFMPSDSIFYMNIKDQNPTTLHIIIDEMGTFGQNASLNVLIFSLYYGLAWMAILFNFVFFLIFLDRRFVTYSLLHLFIFLTFFYEDGMFYYFSGQKWLLPDFPIWNASFASIFAALFTYYFLDLKSQVPHFKKITWVTGVSMLLLSTLYFLTKFDLFIKLNAIAWFGLPAFCFYQAGRLFKKNPYARFLTINFGLVVLVGACYGLYKHFNYSFLSIFNINTLRLASAIEIMTISFALIFKVRTLREENARYKTELKHHLELLKLDREIAYEKSRHETATKDSLQKLNSYPEQELLEDLREQNQLTDREVEVLQCIWQGDSNKDISDKLFISLHTTKFHVSNLYTKLDVKNRSEARSLKIK